jgi:hypothetical protein
MPKTPGGVPLKISVYCFCVVKMEDLYPISVSFRFFVPNRGFTAFFSLVHHLVFWPFSGIKSLQSSKNFREHRSGKNYSTSVFEMKQLTPQFTCKWWVHYSL